VRLGGLCSQGLSHKRQLWKGLWWVLGGMDVCGMLLLDLGCGCLLLGSEIMVSNRRKDSRAKVLKCTVDFQVPDTSGVVEDLTV